MLRTKGWLRLDNVIEINNGKSHFPHSIFLVFFHSPSFTFSLFTFPFPFSIPIPIPFLFSFSVPFPFPFPFYGRSSLPIRSSKVQFPTALYRPSNLSSSQTICLLEKLAPQTAVTRPTRVSKEKAKKVIHALIKAPKTLRKSRLSNHDPSHTKNITPMKSPTSSREQNSDYSEIVLAGVGNYPWSFIFGCFKSICTYARVLEEDDSGSCRKDSGGKGRQQVRRHSCSLRQCQWSCGWWTDGSG